MLQRDHETGYQCRRRMPAVSTTPMLLLFAIVLSTSHWICLTHAWSAPSPTAPPSLVLKPDGSANSRLHNLLESKDTSTRVVLEGFVSKRRALGSSLAFLDVVPSSLPDANQSAKMSDVELSSIVPVQAILRREFWEEQDNDTAAFNTYHKILQPGTYVRLIGHAGPSRVAGEAMLFVSTAEYRLCNSNPQHLRNVLKYARDGLLSIDEVQRALPYASKQELFDGLVSDKGSASKQTCGELAIELLKRFPPNMLLNPSHLMGTTNSYKVALLPPIPPEFTTPPSFSGNIAPARSNSDVVTIATVLQAQAQSKDDGETNLPQAVPFTVSGWVQNRRRFQNSVSVLALVDDFSSLASAETDRGGEESKHTESLKKNEIDIRNSKLKELWKWRIYCVIHPDALKSENDKSTIIEKAEIYGNILCPGARVMLQGHLIVNSSEKKDTDVAEFWVTNCRLLRSSWRPSVIRQVLDLLHTNKIAIDEASDSLNLSGRYAQAEGIAQGSTEATERQWMAAELSRSLQGENSRLGKITPAMKQSLDVFATARDRYPIERVDFGTNSEISHQKNASDILQSSGAPLRTSPEGSRWQRAKKPQLEWMITQISNVLKSHPEYGQRVLKIVDIGGGKGHLSNLLAETFGDDTVEVQVVDISKSAIENGMMRAMRRGLGNIRYDAQDATTLDVSGVDMVVALHACGALSDVALGHAVSQGAGFVIIPCCFRSNPQLRVPIPASKSAAEGSDGCRNIELVTVDEWLDTESTEYEALKKLAELQGDINMAGKAMHTICGLRAAAVERSWRNNQYPKAALSTAVKTFPIGFSTRNFCLVGKYS